jgi:hypothetical protein
MAIPRKIMQPVLFAAGGILFLVAVIVYWPRGSGGVDPQALARQALEGATPQAREAAAVKLAALGERAHDLQVRVLNESRDPNVRAAMIQGLAAQWEYGSMPAFLDAMNDESPLVRGRAGAAVQRMLGADFGFQYDDPPEKRKALIAGLRKEWEFLKKSPGFENTVKALKQKR